MKIRRASAQLAAALLLTASGITLTGGTANAADDCLELPNTGTLLTCQPKKGPQTVPGVGLTGTGSTPSGPSVDDLKQLKSRAQCAATAAQAAVAAIPLCPPDSIKIKKKDIPIPGGGKCYTVPIPKVDGRTCNTD